MLSHHAIRQACSALLALSITTPVAAQFTAPVARLTETLRISGADEGLARIGGVFIAPDGRIGFAQPMDSRVLIYSSEGKRTAAFGRRGRGSGEFQAISTAGWLGDSVWIYDNTARQLSVFTADGAHARSATYSSITVPAKFATLPTSRTGSFRITSPTANGAFIASRVAPPGEFPPTVYARVTRDGQVDRILIQHPRDAGTISIPMGRGTTYTSVPFVHEYNDFVAPDGSRLGYFRFDRSGAQPQLQLLIVHANGDSLVRRSYPFEAVQLTQAEKDSAVAERVKGIQEPATQFGQNGAAQNVVRAYSKEEIDAYSSALRAGIPAVHAPITGARLGLDNTIWVLLRESRGGPQWVALNERGDAEYSVTLPPNTRLVQASRTTLWTIQTDADDSQSIVRFRIDR